MFRYYLGYWEKSDEASIKDFEEKMKKILVGKTSHHEAFARVLFDFHAYAGKLSGIEVIEVRGKCSDLALVERMNQLKPEINIRWVPLIKMSRMLEL